LSFFFGCQAQLKADFAELGKNVEAERVALRMQVHFLNKWTHTAHIYTHIADRVALRMQIHKAQEDAGTLVRNSVQILTSQCPIICTT
jgi:hypothetical protein